MGPDLLQTYDDRYAAARARVASALSGDDLSPSGILLRWMTGTGINPYTVFSHRDQADAFSSAEGAATVLDRIDRAIEEGEVTPHVQEVIAAPPGAFDTFYADVRAYAAAVAEHLFVLEPDLDEPEGPEP